MKRLILILIASLSFSRLSAQEPWTLDQCIAYANEHSQGILQTRMQIENQKISANTSRLYWLPNVSTQLGYYHSHSTTDTQRFHYPYAYVFLSGTLFDGFAGHNTIKAGQAAGEALEANLEEALHNLSVQVSTLYLQSLYLNDQEQLLRAHADTATYTSEAERLQEEANLAEIVDQSTRVRLTLANLIGVPEPLSFEISPLPGGSELSEEQLDVPNPNKKGTTWENAPLIQAARAQLKVSEYNVKVAKSGYYPRLSWNLQTGSYYVDYYQRKDWQAVYGPFARQINDHLVLMPQISLILPIFNGTITRNSVRQSRLAVRNSEESLSAANRQMMIESEQAYTSALAARAKYLAIAATVSAATDWQTRSDLLYARYDYLIKRRILDYYLNIR